MKLKLLKCFWILQFVLALFSILLPCDISSFKHNNWYVSVTFLPLSHFVYTSRSGSLGGSRGGPLGGLGYLPSWPQDDLKYLTRRF